jgi:hypothetical protein
MISFFFFIRLIITYVLTEKFFTPFNLTISQTIWKHLYGFRRVCNDNTDFIYNDWEVSIYILDLCFLVYKNDVTKQLSHMKHFIPPVLQWSGTKCMSQYAICTKHKMENPEKFVSSLIIFIIVNEIIFPDFRATSTEKSVKNKRSQFCG